MGTALLLAMAVLSACGFSLGGCAVLGSKALNEDEEQMIVRSGNLPFRSINTLRTLQQLKASLPHRGRLIALATSAMILLIVLYYSMEGMARYLYIRSIEGKGGEVVVSACGVTFASTDLPAPLRCMLRQRGVSFPSVYKLTHVDEEWIRRTGVEIVALPVGVADKKTCVRIARIRSVRVVLISDEQYADIIQDEAMNVDVLNKMHSRLPFR